MIEDILYAYDLVLISETMENLGEKFQKWKEAFESKGMKVNIGKTKMMVSDSEGEVLKSKIDPCGVCGNRVMSNYVLCKQCGKWIHGRCAKMKRVTTSLAKGFVCVMCRNIAEGWNW